MGCRNISISLIDPATGGFECNGLIATVIDLSDSHCTSMQVRSTNIGYEKRSSFQEIGARFDAVAVVLANAEER
jgi:hypothetical protein